MRGKHQRRCQSRGRLRTFELQLHTPIQTCNVAFDKEVPAEHCFKERGHTTHHEGEYFIWNNPLNPEELMIYGGPGEINFPTESIRKPIKAIILRLNT